jgi:hypothetical protein
MNRRDILKMGMFVPCTAFADCRDDKGMINPDWDDFECHDLMLASPVGAPIVTTGYALFGFGNYETLLEHQSEKTTHAFTFRGDEYRMKVSRLSIDVNRHLGCVVCEVQGRVFT